MTAKLIESFELCSEVRHFVFEVPEVEKFDFQPGQFVSFNETFGDRTITRAYSIASAPNGNRIELCLNRVREGRFSPLLFDMKPGDSLAMKGPLGYFVLRNPGRDVLFIATGTGIAPFRSMLKAHLVQGLNQEYTLLFGVRYEPNLLYREEFEALARQYPNFRFWPTISRPDEGWTGKRGRVQLHIDEVLGNRRDLDIYICGMREMVDEVRNNLKLLGFERRQVIIEKYD